MTFTLSPSSTIFSSTWINRHKMISRPWLPYIPEKNWLCSSWSARDVMLCGRSGRVRANGTGLYFFLLLLVSSSSSSPSASLMRTISKPDEVLLYAIPSAVTAAASSPCCIGTPMTDMMLLSQWIEYFGTIICESARIVSIINPSSLVLETRINSPVGYRVQG